MKTHPCSSCPLPPSPFYKLIPTWMNMKYLVFSPVERGLIEKQEYDKNRVYLKETDVWSHWHILLLVIITISPLFTALSVQYIHSILWKHLFQLSPAKLQKGSQHSCLSSIIHGPRKLLSSHSESGRNYPRKEQSSLISETTNTLERTNHMGLLSRRRLRQHKSTNSDTNHKKLQARQTTISSAIKHPVHFAWLGPDPERHFLIHLTQHPLLHRDRALKSRDRTLIFLSKFSHVG